MVNTLKNNNIQYKALDLEHYTKISREIIFPRLRLGIIISLDILV